MNTATTTAPVVETAHFKQLPKGHLVFLIPSHVQRMLTGCEKLTQNSTGEIVVHYEHGEKRVIPMADLNLAGCNDFLKAFQKVWARMEGLN